MHIIYDTIGFIKTLAFVDVVFFFAVLGLMLLIITLIYFIKENDGEGDNSSSTEDKNAITSIPGIDDEILNLKEIKEALESAEEPEVVNLTKYDEEQEEKAIISYEELLKRKQDFGINYIDEEDYDGDLTVKKVDLENLINKDIIEPTHISVSVISYDKEEAFLEALKNLQHTLN